MASKVEGKLVIDVWRKYSDFSVPPVQNKVPGRAGRVKGELYLWSNRVSGLVYQLQGPDTAGRVENLVLKITCFVMPGAAVDRPIASTDFTLYLQAAAVTANDPITTQGFVALVGNGYVDIKVEVIGVKLSRFFNSERKGRWN